MSPLVFLILHLNKELFLLRLEFGDFAISLNVFSDLCQQHAEAAEPKNLYLVKRHGKQWRSFPEINITRKPSTRTPSL